MQKQKAKMVAVGRREAGKGEQSQPEGEAPGPVEFEAPGESPNEGKKDEGDVQEGWIICGRGPIWLLPPPRNFHPHIRDAALGSGF